jgi:hypothetical protein
VARKSVGEIPFLIYVVVSILAKVTLATKHSFKWGGRDLFEDNCDIASRAEIKANLCNDNRHLPTTKCRVGRDTNLLAGVVL